MNTENTNQNNYVETILASGIVYDASEKIANEFNLHIDQLGELATQVEEVFRGRAKSSDFVKDIMQYLEIDNALANKIAKRVNEEIFQKIKTGTEKQSDESSQSTSSVSTENIPSSTQWQTQQLKNEQAITDLEKVGDFTIERPYKPIDPLMDHLLTTPVVMPPQKTEAKVETMPAAKPAPATTMPPKKSGPDPYREPVQ